MLVIHFDSKGQLRHLLALFSKSRTRLVCKCMQEMGEGTIRWGNTACCLWWSRRGNAVTRCRFGGEINTAYIERLNLKIRNSLAQYVRKSMNCSKILGRHTHALDFFQAWYNFVKSHKSLRLRIDQGRRNGWKEHLLWQKDWRIIYELSMAFRMPIQWYAYTTRVFGFSSQPFPCPVTSARRARILAFKFVPRARLHLDRAELSPQKLPCPPFLRENDSQNRWAGLPSC